MIGRMDRSQIKETFSLQLDVLEGSIEGAICRLQEYAEDGWETLERDWRGDHVFFTLTKYRPETDLEYYRRIQTAEMAEAARRKSRRQLYEELREEFGDQP